MTPEEMEQLADRVAAKVIAEVAEDKGMLIHFTEHAILGDALIVDEATARASPCNCFTYKGRDYCFTKGGIGMLTGGQVDEYCQASKTYEVKPGIKRRFEEFSEAAEEAHKEIEEIPKGERLEPWLRAMGRELEKREIEV